MKFIKNLPFIENKEILPIFATEEFLSSKSDNFGWFMDDDFLIPFVIDKKLFFKRLIFTTEVIYLNSDACVEKEQIFLNEIIDYLKKTKLCDFIYKAQANTVFNVVPENAEGWEWGTYYLNLDLSIEELFKNFHTKHRNVIRRAIKNNVTIRYIDNINIIYKNIKETFIRQNSLYYPSLNYLLKLKENLKNNIIFVGSYYKEELQGCAVILYSKEGAYYLYGGSIQKPFLGSLNYLHYEIIKILKEKDVKKYDFMGARLCYKQGSKFEGLQRFKSRFGCEIKRGFNFIMPINRLKYKMFVNLVKVYFNMKKAEFKDPILEFKECYENTNNIRL